ncbi:hypothetical protein BH10ACT10_BH10ACT10_15080 [soil metagenome]
MRTMKRIAAATAVVSALTLTAACRGSNSSSDTSSSDTASSAAPSAPESSASAPESSAAADPAADPAADLVGKGCAGYAKAVPDGKGSVAGMAADPVAVAAGNNPILKTLTAAVSGKVNPKVNLVDTLNGGEFTVFAPVDDAFAKLPKATLKLLGTPKGADTLTKVLTYHVIPNQMLPTEIEGQSLKSVEGDTVKITGSGDNLKANGAKVICGGVHTANATVYLIDQVMMPKSGPNLVVEPTDTHHLSRAQPPPRLGPEAAPSRAEIGWINVVASTFGSGPLLRPDTSTADPAGRTHP